MKKMLCGICLILLLTSHALFAHETKGLKVDVLVKTSASWDGSPLPSNYPAGKPQVTILKIVIPPKFKLPLHRHPVINAGVLLKGKLTVITKDGKILHLKAGDPIVEVVNKWHYGKNEGTEPAVIIVFYAGVQGTPITVFKKPAKK